MGILHAYAAMATFLCTLLKLPNPLFKGNQQGAMALAGHEGRGRALRLKRNAYGQHCMAAWREARAGARSGCWGSLRLKIKRFSERTH
jgi:hypothetical protein